MNRSRVVAVFFSPTGNTRTIAQQAGGRLACRLGIPFESVDITLPAARRERQVFSPEDLVIAALPVYAGRVPNKLLPYVKEGLSGNGAWAVPIVTFGNRSYGDALAELRDELEQNGFRTVAAAAFVTGHAFSDKLAPGRPDGADMAALEEFTLGVAEKCAALTDPGGPVPVAGNSPAGPYYKPLGLDGQPVNFLKAVPQIDRERCDGCGICARRCPMGSIRMEAPWDAVGVCIKCHACVRACPSGARYFDHPALLSHLAMLERHLTQRQEPALFL